MKSSLCANNVLDYSRSYQLALGKEERKCWYGSNKQNYFNNAITCNKSGQPLSNFEIIGEVDIITLDHFFEKFPLRVDYWGEKENIGVLKIDVEGFEFSIFQSGKFFFETTPPSVIYFEYAPMFIEYNHPEMKAIKILEYINEEMKYDIYDMNCTTKLHPSNYSKFQISSSTYNFCGIHSSTKISL